MNNPSQGTPARRKSARKLSIVTITFVIVIAVLAAVAVLQNREVKVEALRDGIGMTLRAAEQPAAPTTTSNDSSPIVTALDADVVTQVRGPTKAAPVEPTSNGGLSTHGAASPIVTGKGAVVRSTVDTRP